MKRIIVDDSLGKELIEKGRRQAKKFPWKTSIEKHIELFEECLNR
jgi:glycosyltransferase involved in cell wall biosynthesis